MNEPTDRCVQVLAFAEPVLAVAWSPDGGALAIGDERGGIEVMTVAGRRRWRRREHGDEVGAVCWSGDGGRLASASYDKHLRVWSAETGEELLRCPTGDYCLSLAWSPDDRRLACDAEGSVRIFDAVSGEVLQRCSGEAGGVLCVAWSPDGTRLASGSQDKAIRLWDAATGGELRHLAGHTAQVRGLAWSPDGGRLASASDDQTVRIWKADDGRCLGRCLGHHHEVNGVCWSPDGKLVASASTDHTVRLWSAAGGHEVARLASHTLVVHGVEFSPDGTRLASASGDRTVRIWDVADLTATATTPEIDAWAARQAATVGRQARDPARAVPAPLAPLPPALAELHGLGLAVPLSLLAELLGLVGGGPAPALTALAGHAGVRGLAGLRWPAAARAGLVALLVHDLEVDPIWEAPAGTSQGQLRRALGRALAGEVVPARAPVAPQIALLRTADRIDDRLLTLLAAIGPEAVAADPGLPLRLLPRVPELLPLAAARRRLLGLRLEVGERGAAQGQGPGSDRTGLAVRGRWRDLLPSQLALPPAVMRCRQLRGELLYRARSGREPPQLRPAVVVLDVSPPTFGPVEAVTRAAAHVIASSLLEARIEVVLVTAGGRGTVRVLERRSDLIEIWTLRSTEPAAAGRCLRVAAALRREVEGGLEPVVVVLSHPLFGAEDELPPVPSLRGLFVHFPGLRSTPRLAARCERWAAVDPGAEAQLGAILAGLVG